MAFQIGLEDVVAEALLWGRDHLGIDTAQIVLSGGSRGGYASMVLSSRLHAMEEFAVQAVASSVFGTGAAELSAMPELAAVHIEDRARLGSAELRRKMMGTSDIDIAFDRGPLGSAKRLAAHPDPPRVYVAWGGHDPTMLPSSAIRVFDALSLPT